MKRIVVVGMVLGALYGCTPLMLDIPPELPNESPIAEWAAIHWPESSNPYTWEFDGEDRGGSYDPDGEIVAWIWRINGERFDTPAVVYTFPQAGCYQVSLTVIDDDGASETLEAWPGGLFNASSQWPRRPCY